MELTMPFVAVCANCRYANDDEYDREHFAGCTIDGPDVRHYIRTGETRLPMMHGSDTCEYWEEKSLDHLREGW